MSNNKMVGNTQPSAQPRQPAKAQDPLVVVKQRSEFYSDGLLEMKKFARLSFAGFAVCIFIVGGAVTYQAKRTYIATDETHRIIELVPLSSPNTSDSVVANWTGNALIDTFDFSYVNMKTHLAEATLKWFNDNGRQELLDGLAKTGNFDAVLKNKLIVSLSTEHVPLVVKKGVAFNKYLWKLEVPAIITFRTESALYSNKVLFTVTVARRSLLDNKDGLGIERIVMEITNK